MAQVHATVFAGVEYDAQGHFHTQAEQAAAIARIEQAIVDTAGGCTLAHTTGSWKHPTTGEVVRERAIRVDVMVDDESTGRIIANFIKRTLNQYSVLLEMQEVKGEFV